MPAPGAGFPQRNVPGQPVPPTDRTDTDYDDEVSLHPLAVINLLLRWRKLVICCVVAGVVAATLLATRRAPVFEASVEFVSNPAARAVVGGGPAAAVGQRDPLEYYSRLLVSSPVIGQVLSRGSRNGTPLKNLLNIEGGTPEHELLLARRYFSGDVIQLERSGRSSAANLTQILVLHARSPEPELAADLANAFIEELSRYDRRVNSAAARERREYIESRIEQTEMLLKRAEDELRDFKDRNRILALAESSPSGAAHIVIPAQLQLIRDRLDREVGVQSELYLTLKKELELAKIAENDEASPISIFERAFPPLAPMRSRLPTWLLVVLGGLVGLVAGVGLALVLEMTANADVETPEGQEFLGHLAAIRSNLTKVGGAFHLRFHSRKTHDEKVASGNLPRG